MTAQSEALDRLIAAVEAGDAEIVGPFLSAMGMNSQNSIHAMNAYSGSRDAAKALHDALLPGWGYGVTMNDEEPVPAAFVCLIDDSDIGFEATSEIPARAWLLAILRAYRTTLQ